MENAISELTKCFNRALNAYDQVLKDRDSEISACRSSIYGLERQIGELETENTSLKSALKKSEDSK